MLFFCPVDLLQRSCSDFESRGADIVYLSFFSAFFTHRPMLLKLFIFAKKGSSSKRKRDIFSEKTSWIRRFGIRENMSRTNYNLRFLSWNSIIYSLSLWSQNKFHYWSVRNRYRLQQAMRHFLEIKIWPRYVAQVVV